MCVCVCVCVCVFRINDQILNLLNFINVNFCLLLSELNVCQPLVFNPLPHNPWF